MGKIDSRLIELPIDTDALEALIANADILTYHNAGTHNALYRGKNLGSSLTEEQNAAIRAGTFDGVYVGDYWTFENVSYSYVDENDAMQTDTYSGTMRVTDCDYYFKCGDFYLRTHHIVVVPDEPMFNAPMNDTGTTDGDYVGSKMYTTYLRKAEAIVKACFGEGHVIPRLGYLDGRNVFNRLVDLMNEFMIYGTLIWGSKNINSYYSYSCKQLSLFRHRPDLISNDNSYWLRNVFDDSYFAYINSNGGSAYNIAFSSAGVRPYALIC